MRLLICARATFDGNGCQQLSFAGCAGFDSDRGSDRAAITSPALPTREACNPPLRPNSESEPVRRHHRRGPAGHRGMPSSLWGESERGWRHPRHIGGTFPSRREPGSCFSPGVYARTVPGERALVVNRALRHLKAGTEAPPPRSTREESTHATTGNAEAPGSVAIRTGGRNSGLGMLGWAPRLPIRTGKMAEASSLEF
jgi:hypothetical protein